MPDPAQLRLDARPTGRKVPWGALRPQLLALTPSTSLPLWWWTPDRTETRERLPDRMFQEKLEQGFPGIVVNWHPLRQRWQVWARSNRVRTPYCRGWLLLFTHEGPNGEYLPLDERIFVIIWDRSAKRWGNGRQYFDRIEAEIQHDKEKRAKDLDDERDYMTSEYWNYTLIKNIGQGSKFVQHHAGD